MTAALRSRCLRHRGSAAVLRYVAAVEAIAGDFTPGLCRFAEAVCPSLARLRRHARACAKLARRLGGAQ